eukprot:1817134-Rhodomonas_salina.6
MSGQSRDHLPPPLLHACLRAPRRGPLLSPASQRAGKSTLFLFKSNSGTGKLGVLIHAHCVAADCGCAFSGGFSMGGSSAGILGSIPYA